MPGDDNCPAKSLEETYGFQWCPGDDELLKFVGRQGYRDPACDFTDGPFDISTPHGEVDQRQDSCDLRFGTSTGALGLRKFPNPRFDSKAWTKVNGSLASWDGYREFLSGDPNDPDSRMNRLFDGSIEPPFRIGMACGACHIAYDPLNEPADPNNPEWENIVGLAGNQYSRISNMLGAGMSEDRLEWQLIARSRPGVVDTSALPMDLVSNPGTMNAIINLGRRPEFEHRVLKWRKAGTCQADADPKTCWCEPGKPGKCWERSEKPEMVPNILKGGEDSIGLSEAIQRVYFNIGSCAEQCWVNHVPDLRAADPSQRNYGQTPFDIGQCRRDCGSFRAMEDRLEDVKAFFLTARPTDLWQARGLDSPRDLEIAFDEEFFKGAVTAGRDVFAKTCARCHSSQSGPYDNVDFHATTSDDSTLRKDWLGNDNPEFASQIGTYTARAMHSNHMQTRVWAQYSALDLFERAADPNLDPVMKGGGRGYYRNISLLSAWAHAPFTQNNAIGPEICGKPSDTELDFYSSPYVDEDGKMLADPPPCLKFDPGFKGRYALYKASMELLLNPDRRIPKMFVLDQDIIIEVAPELKIGDLELGLSIRVPKGFPAVAVNSLRYKDMIQDLVLVENDSEKFAGKYEALLTAPERDELMSGLKTIRQRLAAETGRIVLALVLGRDSVISDIAEQAVLEVDNAFIQRFYSNVLGRIENAGHRFGEGLSEREKQALIAFVATL